MAYVVRRPRGSWEIRESVTTPRGPRSRTLATFRRLTPAVIDAALARAQRPTSASEIREAARRVGAESGAADAAARALLAELGYGRLPAPRLRQLLLRLLTNPTDSDPVVGDAVQWIEASPEERGRTLEDLLHFVDALPPRPDRPLRFPPLGASHA